MYNWIIRNIVLVTVLLASNTVWAIPDKYKDLRWHYLSTSDFEIVSLDPNIPAVIQSYLSEVKAWTARRWGLPDLPFRQPCMIVCFPSQAVFSELTKKDTAEARVMKTQGLDGKDRLIYAIWVSADPNGDWLKTTLPECIARAVLMNYQDTYRINMPAWLQLGMSYLNNDILTLKESLKQINVADKSIYTMSLDDFYKKSPAERLTIKRRCATACLMIRKELGGVRFAGFFSKVTTASLNAGITYLGYRDIQDFVDKQNVYCRNLSYDLSTGRTPNLYLTWYVR